MAITLTNDSATIGTTEYSLPADANYSAGSPQTDDCILQVWIDFAAMTAAETYKVKVYEKVNGGTQAIAYEATLVGVQSSLFVLPCLIVGEGWDVTVDKIAGTDRSIGWSIRKVT